MMCFYWFLFREMMSGLYFYGCVVFEYQGQECEESFIRDE